MSDLEKYFALAVWANQRVEYDWKFWHNSYNFDYCSHQWDAYGAMNEDETSVCVGIAIFYSNLCHAADLPCRFVRLNPGFLEHTFNYIPDINGNAYYADITVFIGAPVWWGDWPMIMYTFFEENADALAGKTLIPFSTHAGSGLSGFDSKLASACPESTVGEGLAIAGTDAQNDQDSVRSTVNDWLSCLGY